MTTGPSFIAVNDGNDALHAWEIRRSNALFFTWRNNDQWTAWTPGWNNAPRLQSISAVNDANNALHVFAIGLDNTLYLSWRGGNWSPWLPAWNAAPKVQAVSAVNDANNALHVFAIGLDNTLYLSWRGGGWSAWLAGWNKAPKLQSVIAVNDANNTLHVFGIGLDNTLHLTWRGGNWSSWLAGWNRAPKLQSVVAVNDSNNVLHVFGIGVDNTLHLTQRNDGNWSAWMPSWNNAPRLRSVVAVNDSQNSLHVFGLGVDNTLHLAWRNNGNWSAWMSAWNKAPRLQSVFAVNDKRNRLHVYGVGEDNILYLSWRDNGRWSPWAPPQPRFSPAVHGFRFQNDGFANDVIPALNYRTDALCGGMAYAALDYYHAKAPIPNQPFRPASQTTLRGYIYDRQVSSIVSNLDKWAEVTFNPDGARNAEFFNWGISARIDELKKFLDQGTPCVVNLAGGNGWGHQVVAYDYTMGRYRGDLGNYVEDFKIHVYDPNHAGVMTTIVADRARQVFRREDGSGDWRTYFVDGNYHAQTPPAVYSPSYPTDKLVYELVLQFSTGGDDLRGGNDNVDMAVRLTDGSQQIYRKINLGGRWVVGSNEYAQVVLQRPVRPDQLRELDVRTTFGGGLSGDNWDMSSLVVYQRGGDFFTPIASAGAKRFTASDNMLIVPIHPLASSGLSVLVHLQGIGDKVFAADQLAGTRNQGRQVEGFQISFTPPVAGLGLLYSAYVQGIGNTPWMRDGQFVGTRGQGRRIEGFAIKLSGALAGSYTVEYLAHLQNTGDLPFARDGEVCGLPGQPLAVEGILVRVIRKA